MAERMSQHLNPDEIEQWAEGLLPTARAMHLTECATCLATAERERRFFLQLAQLERFAPAENFAERVLANVRIPTPSGGYQKQ
jgi:hypothetical protein